MIRITSRVDGYRRCGVLHPARPTEYEDGRFSPEELAVLQADPLLTVEVETPAAPDFNDLESLTVAQLKALAAERGLAVPAKVNKVGLLALLSSPDGQVDAPPSGPAQDENDDDTTDDLTGTATEEDDGKDPAGPPDGAQGGD